MQTQMSPQIGNLVKALVQVQSKLKPAKKDSQNPFFKSYYSDLASVWDSSRELLAANGLAIIQYGGPDQTLVTTLAHVSGEWISGIYPLVTSKDRDPQSLGASTTYARRYCLAAILGVVSDDDDAESAVDRTSIIQQKMNSLDTNQTMSQRAARPSSPLSPQGAFGPETPDTIPIKIREIGGRKYSEVPMEELQKHVNMIEKAYLKNQWPIAGHVAEFIDTVRNMDVK